MTMLSDINRSITIFPSQVRASATNNDFDDLRSFGARSIEVVTDLTAFVTAASLTVSIDMKVGDKYINLVTGAAIVATGQQRLRVSPDLVAAANLVANAHAPVLFRIRIAHANANSHTYSVTLLRYDD